MFSILSMPGWYGYNYRWEGEGRVEWYTPSDNIPTTLEALKYHGIGMLDPDRSQES